MPDSDKVRHWAIEQGLKHLFGWLMVLSLGLLGWAFQPIKERMIAFWNLPKTLLELQDSDESRFSQIESRIEAALNDIIRLKVPKDIFDVEVDQSGPVEGFCVEAEPCTIRIRARRFPDTIACQVIPDASRYSFIDTRTDTVVAATRLDQPLRRNLGAEWEFFDVTVMTPIGLSPRSRFMYTNYYTGCPNTPSEMSPLQDTSPRIHLDVKAKRDG